MKIYLGTLSLLVIMLTVTVSSAQGVTEEKKVKESFEGYKTSILASNGEDAIRWVDSNTISYYSEMLDASLSADSATVQNMGIMDKLMVLMVRHRVPKDKVMAMDGHSFFVYAIDEGMVGKNSVVNLDIGEIRIDGESAQGQVVNNGIAAPLYFGFKKEDSGWKIDITSIFGPSSAALEEAIKSFGQTENEFIFQTLEMLTGRTLDDGIWHPLK